MDPFGGVRSAESRGLRRAWARSLMKKAGLEVKQPKQFKKTTDSRHKLPVAPNRLDQQFRVDEPNKIWCGDITYLWTLEGWLYLAVIIDLYSRKVVGWALDRQLKTSLVLEALRMAYWRQKPAPGLIYHSDRGSQYATGDYQRQLEIFHMIPSMSRKGDCYDNAVAESFFHTLKTEEVGDQAYSTPGRGQGVRLSITSRCFITAAAFTPSWGMSPPMILKRSYLWLWLLNWVSVFT